MISQRRTTRRAVSLVAVVCAAVMLAGCGGSSSSAAVKTVTVAPTTAGSETTAPAIAKDAQLASDIAAGLGRLSAITANIGVCGSNLDCINGITVRLGAFADRELVGLKQRVNSATLPCLRDAGNYYVLALKGEALARDYVRSGSTSDATDVLVGAAGDIKSAGDIATSCTAQLTGG